MQRPNSVTLSTLIDELAARYPRQCALTCGSDYFTFQEIRSRVMALAKGLYSDGVRKGDKVAILMGNCAEWPIALFAIQCIGAVMVAVNTWYTQREIAYVLRHSEVSVLITADRFLKADYLEIIGNLIDSGDVPALRTVVIVGADHSARPGWLSYKSLIDQGVEIPNPTIDATAGNVRPENIAYILYTSGSTARPKGVTLKHNSLLENSWNIGERLRLDCNDRLFLPISLFWGLGCENALLASWTHGVHIVLQHHFDPKNALEVLESHRCTAIYCTANITTLLFEHADIASYNLGALKKGTVGGPPDLIRKVVERYVSMGCHAYGLTESYGYSSVNDAEDPIVKRAETFGRPLPGNSIRIVAPDSGEVLPCGTLGEIRQKGHIMAGYYNSPEQTAEAFDEHGFFKTGDVGCMDEEGYLSFKGRLKEMLRTSGMNVAPAEVEDILRTHPAIHEAFVTGLPDPQREQIIAAAVLLEPGSSITEDEVKAHCRKSLAGYKIPRRIRFVEYAQLPMTTTGKIHRRRLAELFEGA